MAEPPSYILQISELRHTADINNTVNFSRQLKKCTFTPDLKNDPACLYIKMRRILFLNWIFLACILSVSAQVIPGPMDPPRFVNDFAGVFTDFQNAEIEDMLLSYQDSTSTQVYVVTVNSLDGDAPYNFAHAIMNKWGIGQKGKDNGVLILIKPKTGSERGEVYIGTG